MKKPLALLGVSAVVGFGVLLIGGPAQAEATVGDENPCNVQGWYVNPDETANAPTRTVDGFVFEGKDLIHHATRPIDLPDIKPYTGAFEATVAGKVVFKMETENPYSTIVQNADKKFWSTAMLATQDGGQNNPVENVSDLIGKDVKPGKVKYGENSHVVTFGVGYWQEPGSTTVKSITFHGTKYNLTCKLATPTPTPTPTTKPTPPVVKECAAYTYLGTNISLCVDFPNNTELNCKQAKWQVKLVDNSKDPWELDGLKGGDRGVIGVGCESNPVFKPKATPTTTTPPVGGLPVTGDSNGKKIAAAGGVAAVLGAIALVVARKRRETKFVAE